MTPFWIFYGSSRSYPTPVISGHPRRRERLKKASITLLPDCRESTTLLVHQDFVVHFDDNSYTTPPWTIGRRLALKADQTTLTLYHRQKQVAVHHRSWERKKRIELPAHQEQVKKLHHKLWQGYSPAVISGAGNRRLSCRPCRRQSLENKL